MKTEEKEQVTIFSVKDNSLIVRETKEIVRTLTNDEAMGLYYQFLDKRKKIEYELSSEFQVERKKELLAINNIITDLKERIGEINGTK
jgi:hypothetical protein